MRTLNACLRSLLSISLMMLGLMSEAQSRLAPGNKQTAEKPEKYVWGENVLWRDPGDVASLDFTYGVGGSEFEPKPPFTFVQEDLSGSNPKVMVTDANGRKWSVKWGKEAHSDVFASRLAWACGFIAQPMYFVGRGQIGGIGKPLKRAGSEIRADGYFSAARFQLRSDNPKFLKDAGWAWVNNPFRGSPLLRGLQALMMLVSDWDNKDARDTSRDSNLGIFEEQAPDGPRYLYFISDWGGSMGRWGNVATRSKWDVKGFAAQTPGFVRRSDSGLDWGYTGQRTEDFVKQIRPSDIAWLLQYLGRVTDDQIRAGLRASGATSEEIEGFTASLRDRISQLQRVSQSRKPICYSGPFSNEATYGLSCGNGSRIERRLSNDAVPHVPTVIQTHSFVGCGNLAVLVTAKVCIFVGCGSSCSGGARSDNGGRDPRGDAAPDDGLESRRRAWVHAGV